MLSLYLGGWIQIIDTEVVWALWAGYCIRPDLTPRHLKLLVLGYAHKTRDSN